jgi:TolB protein
MTPRSSFAPWLATFFALLAAGAVAGRPGAARAQGAPLAPGTPPGPATGPDAQPDESVLGTVDVNGSAGGLPPLPKLAVVPIVTTGTADSLVNLVVRHDMDLSGQFEVLGADGAPAGPFTHDSALDLAAWRATGAEYVLRVYAEPAPNDSTQTQLVAEAYVTPSEAQAAAQRKASASSSGGDAPRPAFRGTVPTATTEVRAASHRLVDQVLGALTGRPGGFASEMVYTERVGRWRRVFTVDADGFDLRPIGPTDAVAISPAFGPGHEIYYALSSDYSPFRLVAGPDARPVDVAVPGSILGLAFSADHKRLALTVMSEGKGAVWTGPRDKLQPMAAAAPFANHPVFGPLGKVAYVAGSPVQRIYIDGKPVSPPGFMASAPVFCDAPEGLFVIYTVGVGASSDILATDTAGGGMRRLTQHEGANTYAACSPDGRLVAFFSTGKKNKLGQSEGAGLFVMPIMRPGLSKKISNEIGESLRWEALP